MLAGGPARTLLILPLNVTAAMPPELETLSPAVWAELKRYCLDHGKQLKTVAFADARQLWLVSVARARKEDGERAGFDEAARRLVLALANHAEFDIVIVPTLFVREAPISGRSASWDGVERDVEFEAYSQQAQQIAASTPLEGIAPAASLHAVVLDAEGNKLQEGPGGLALLVRVRVRTTLSPSSPALLEFSTRTDLSENREHLREGIAEALAPFLPPRPPRAD